MARTSAAVSQVMVEATTSLEPTWDLTGAVRRSTVRFFKRTDPAKMERYAYNRDMAIMTVSFTLSDKVNPEACNISIVADSIDDIMLCAKVLMSARQNEEGSLPVDALKDLIKNMSKCAQTKYFGIVPQEYINMLHCKMDMYVYEGETDYGAVVTKTEDEARQVFMKRIADNGDGDTMQSWARRGLQIESYQIEAYDDEPATDPSELFKAPLLAEVPQSVLEEQRKRLEDYRRRQRERAAEAAAAEAATDQNDESEESES